MAIKTRSVQNEFDAALINGIKGTSASALTHVTATGTESTYTMGGLLYFLGLTSDIIGNTLITNITTTTETLTETVLNDLNAKVYEDTNRERLPKVCLATSTLARKIALWGKDRVRYAAHPRVVGAYATEFLTDLGNTLRVVADDNLPKGWIVLFDPQDIKRRTLVPWIVAPIAQAVEWADKARMITVFTAEFRNANKTMAAHYGLS